MQEHWLRVAPPAYVTSAGMAGWKPPDVPQFSDEMLEDPDQLESFLSSISGGCMIP